MRLAIRSDFFCALERAAALGRELEEPSAGLPPVSSRVVVAVGTCLDLVTGYGADGAIEDTSASIRLVVREKSFVTYEIRENEK